MSGKFFSSPFLYVSGKCFWFRSEKKVATWGGGENFNHEKKNLASPKIKYVPPPTPARHIDN
jgi:hypothetical protein